MPARCPRRAHASSFSRPSRHCLTRLPQDSPTRARRGHIAGSLGRRLLFQADSVAASKQSCSDASLSLLFSCLLFLPAVTPLIPWPKTTPTEAGDTIGGKVESGEGGGGGDERGRGKGEGRPFWTQIPRTLFTKCTMMTDSIIYLWIVPQIALQFCCWEEGNNHMHTRMHAHAHRHTRTHKHTCTHSALSVLSKESYLKKKH